MARRLTAKNRSRHFLGAAFAVGLSLVVTATTAAVADETSIQRIELNALDRTPLPAFPGVSSAFVTGAFDQPGLYTAFAEMAAGSTFPPHSHPDLRLTVVIAGTMYLGEGDIFDTDRLIAYPAGSVAVTPPDTAHFMAARDGGFRVLEIGSGPSGATFFGKD